MSDVLEVRPDGTRHCPMCHATATATALVHVDGCDVARHAAEALAEFERLGATVAQSDRCQ